MLLTSHLLLQCLKKKTFDKLVLWWSPELSQQRLKVNKLRRSFQRTIEQQLRVERRRDYNSEKQYYKLLIQKNKIESWQKFSTTDNASDKPYKIAANKINQNEPISTLKKPDGSFTEGQRETMSFLLNKLFQDDDSSTDTSDQTEIRLTANKPILTNIDQLFSDSEIEELITQLNPNKSPGWDKITADVIQKVHESIPQQINKLYNMCLQLNYFPIAWKVAL
jgi:hypothetical protein